MNFEGEHSDISENLIRETMPGILDILLVDRTKSTSRKNKNIIWATDTYIKHGGEVYGPKNEILPELISGIMGHVIMPRALKHQELQKERTKSRAEVFTPTWVVKKQNDAVDENYMDDDLEEYIDRTWLEITCGEAPYMASRYEMETGQLIEIENRVGFVDRKLSRINKEVTDKAEWQRLVEAAYKASYGFEWSGDSLLIARENLLYTYIDYYNQKWKDIPTKGLLEKIAIIISYNIFQMDGLKYIIPLTEGREKKEQLQLTLFEEEIEEEWVITPGRRVKVMNWKTKKMENFDKDVK